MNKLVALLVAMMLPAAASAQVIIGARPVQSPYPSLGTRCVAHEPAPADTAMLPRPIFASDGILGAARDLRIGAATDDEAALERARAFFAKAASSLSNRLLSSRATLWLAILRNDAALLDQAFAAAAPRLSLEDGRIASPQRAALLVDAETSRAHMMLYQADAIGGERGATLSADAERRIRALAAAARAGGDDDAAEDLIQTAASTALRRALARAAWPEARATVDELEASAARERDPRRNRLARITYAGALASIASSGAPPAMRDEAARAALTVAASVVTDLAANGGRSPSEELRLDQLAGAVSGQWFVLSPAFSLCPMAARLEVDRSVAELMLATSAAAQTAARRRLEASDAMLADVPAYRRGLLAPFVLARSYAAADDRGQAAHWYLEAGRRAARCFCTDDRAAAALELAKLGG